MEELDLKQLFKIFASRKIYMILITIIFILLGIVYTLTMVKPRYKSSTKLILAKTETTSENGKEITSSELTLNQKLISTYSEIVKTKSVLRQVIDNLDLDLTEETLEKSISIKLKNDTDMIEITITNDNPENAAIIANEVAKVFSAKVAEVYNINNIKVMDKAEVDNSPYNINHPKDVAIFALVGIVVAVIYAIVANMLDTTIKSNEDIEKNIKLTVLAEIPLCESFDMPMKRGGRK